MTIPLPGVPPLVVAAIARGGRERADELLELHTNLITLLHSHSIHPLSLCADGSVVERNLLRSVVNSAPRRWQYTVKNKQPRFNLMVDIPIYFGLPSVPGQDSKHAAKTGRNQLQTGARCLSIANFSMYYSYLRDIAFHAIGPLFKRDVEKVDRQDDRAASRLFSPEVLDFQHRFFPNRYGLSVYLFVIGELVDAWQNRAISHLVRARMVLRARFFFDGLALSCHQSSGTLAEHPLYLRRRLRHLPYALRQPHLSHHLTP